MIPVIFLVLLWQDPVSPKKPVQAPVTAFPDSPKAPPPRVKDISVPPAPLTPGALGTPVVNTSVPLTAIEAVKIALHLQPNLGVSVGAIQVQQGSTQQTASAEHPQVNLGAGYNQIHNTTSADSKGTTAAESPNVVLPAGVSAVNPMSVGLDVKQLIFDFNLTRNLVRQSQALERSAKQDLTTAQLSLALSVKVAFYNYASALRVVKVNEANVANRQRQLDLANAKLTNGVGEPSDVATAQTSKSQGIYQLSQARNLAEQDRILLLQQMGVDPLTPVVASNDAAVGSSDTDAHTLTQNAIRLRPEVKSAIETLAAARYGLRAARSVDLPAIYAEIGAGMYGTSLPLNNNSTNISIGFQFPIFDGGNRSGAMKTASGKITTADANLKTAVLQVKTDVASAFMGLKSATQQTMIADNEVVNAREDVRVAEGRYRAGIGLFLDVTTAQTLLLSAETDQETARNNLNQARTLLQHADGELLADL